MHACELLAGACITPAILVAGARRRRSCRAASPATAACRQRLDPPRELRGRASGSATADELLPRTRHHSRAATCRSQAMAVVHGPGLRLRTATLRASLRRWSFVTKSTERILAGTAGSPLERRAPRPWGPGSAFSASSRSIRGSRSRCGALGQPVLDHPVGSRPGLPARRILRRSRLPVLSGPSNPLKQAESDTLKSARLRGAVRTGRRAALDLDLFSARGKSARPPEAARPRQATHRGDRSSPRAHRRARA